ncbi:hypothetical protein SASPL_108695 [Salvia splendens]|uniref:Uncharacterized protein n=1 Tax=Salvia splendens TaxID=180675 RepID=A0A8X8YJA0_SALSN|nr:hypothetical protein SASPL_108695 [Salvia splendens]
MRNKSWPHWEAWKEIYGKDRASGDKGKGAEEAMNKMKATQENINAYEGDYCVNLEEFFADEVILDHVMSATADGSQLNEFDQSVKRSEVYKLLGVIPGLTMKHKFYTSAKLVKEPELLDLFMSIPEIDRPDFVVFLLETDGVLGVKHSLECTGTCFWLKALAYFFWLKALCRTFI